MLTDRLTFLTCHSHRAIIVALKTLLWFFSPCNMKSKHLCKLWRLSVLQPSPAHLRLFHGNLRSCQADFWCLLSNYHQAWASATPMLLLSSLLTSLLSFVLICILPILRTQINFSRNLSFLVLSVLNNKQIILYQSILYNSKWMRRKIYYYWILFNPWF